MIIPFKKIHQDALFICHWKLLIFLTLLVCAFSYHFFDIPLAYAFQHVHGPLKVIAALVSDIAHPNTNYVVWPLLFFIFKLLKKKEALTNRLLLFVISVPLANLIIYVMKCIAGRARPHLLFSKEIFGFTWFKFTNAYFSFPSGHGCTLGACFGILACFYPRLSWLFLALACILSLCRIVLTDHYLSDVLAGVVIGALISQGVYVFRKKSRLA